jgi:nucleotide-binding universal stress UspA family protein
MGRIVVGVDGSNSSRNALRWAADEAEKSGATLDVVMTWHDPYPEMWIPRLGPTPDPLGLTRTALERVVTGTLGDHPSVKVEQIAAEGHAARVLVEAATGAELLVVGSRGLGGFAGVALGSVSLHCVAHAPCPVVVVR